MADLAAADVTLIRPLNYHAGVSRLIKRGYFKITFATQGDGTTGKKVPAAAFGLTQFTAPAHITNAAETAHYTAHPLVDDAETVFGTELIVQDTYHATGAKANLTGDHYAVVEGVD